MLQPASAVRPAASIREAKRARNILASFVQTVFDREHLVLGNGEVLRTFVHVVECPCPSIMRQEASAGKPRPSEKCVSASQKRTQAKVVTFVRFGTKLPENRENKLKWGKGAACGLADANPQAASRG